MAKLVGKYFHLQNPETGLVVDVIKSRRDPRSKVGLWTKRNENNENQLWYYHHYTGTIRSRLNDFCLDVKDGDLVMNPFDFYHTRRWMVMANRICLEDDKEEVVEIADEVPSEGSHLRVGHFVNSRTQHFVILHAKPECFFIKSKMCDHVLRVSSTKPNASVVTGDMNNHAINEVLWYEDEFGYVRSRATGYALDIDPNSGSIITTPFDENNRSQRFVIEGDSVVNHEREEGVCVLDINASNKKTGADIIAFERSGNDNQRWEVELFK